jgi:hypothetical protein
MIKTSRTIDRHPSSETFLSSLNSTVKYSATPRSQTAIMAAEDIDSHAAPAEDTASKPIQLSEEYC